MLREGKTYSEVCSTFAWDIPEYYNIGVDVCDKWAERKPSRPAITFLQNNGEIQNYSFGDLKKLSNQFCNFLKSLGIKRGDRIGISLPQCPETAIGHIAAYKCGAIAIPLFNLFGPSALAHRLLDSGAKCVLTDAQGVKKLSEILPELPNLEFIISIDDGSKSALNFYEGLETGSVEFEPVRTKAEDPALIIYTSGTTGQPKGALHAHRVLLGHLPGVEISHDFFPKSGDKIWTPADWAWIGGLLDVLLPALHHGIPVVARRFEKFTPEEAFELLETLQVRNAFVPPTALKMMRSVTNVRDRWQINLRTIASGGESLGSELLEWGRETFGVTINEFYGQTECNMIVSSCAAIMPAQPGMMGKPVPGHQLAVLDKSGQPLPEGEVGMIAVSRPDPVMFLGYWNNKEETAKKFTGDWLLTGDTGVWKSDGWLRFVGREDDLITSSGYRIGPGEVEDCLIRHAAVKVAGVVGTPDPERTEIVTAFIVLNHGYGESEDLKREIQEFVREHLAAHEYPRRIIFVPSLPLTTTGKIIRRELRRHAAATSD